MQKLTVFFIFLALIDPTFSTWAGDADKAPPGTKEDARQLLEKFMQPGADLKALSDKLRPSPDDCAAVFVGKAVRNVQENMAAIPWDDKGFAKNFAPEEGHTELLLFSATTEDFKFKGFENPNKEADAFPKGYYVDADNFKPGVTWYCWGFVKPGEEIGWPIQALTYVNGRWVLFLKAYALSEEIRK